MPEQSSYKSLLDWTIAVEEWASGLQGKTEDVTLEPTLNAVDILHITTRAGRLLGATEQLFNVYLQQSGPASMAILSRIMTVVATARDQIDAAEGHIKNFKAKIGMIEVWKLAIFVFLPATVAYILFHPQWGVFQIIPAMGSVYWEIIYWSIFGAIALSLVTISEVTFNESFDPRHPFKYFYRIPTAPLFATAIILLLSVIGFDISSNGTSGSTTKLTVDLASPNIFLVIGLSFLLGFFSKRALELLDLSWRRLFPSSRSTTDNQNLEANP